MKIKELYIENFGKLSGYRQAFDDGINIFQYDNGYGKTTITVFIKSMLYGLEDTRRQNLSENDRKKYLPWQGGAAGGWLVFETGGKLYRIERTFGQKASDDKFSLYKVDTGMTSSDFSSNLGEELFGIDADGFERTVFLSEKNIKGKNDNPTISAKLSNLVGVEGDIGGFDDAIDLLEKRRKFYQKKGGSGEIQEIRRSIANAEDELRLLDEKRKLCQESERIISDTSLKISKVKAKKEALAAKQEEYIIEKEKRSYAARYQEMLYELSEDRAKLAHTATFFERKLPTSYEIADAESSLAEAQRLESVSAASAENDEYTELSKFFSSGTSYEECEEAARLAHMLEESLDYADEKKEISTPFLRIPTESEIEEASAKLGKNKKKSAIKPFTLLTLIGIITLGVGLTLGIAAFPALYALCAAGAIVTAIGIAGQVSSHGKQPSSEVTDFIAQIYGNGYSIENELSALISMRAELEIYKTKLLQARRKQAELQEASEWLDRFISRFPINASSLTEKIRLIQTKYRRFRFLEQSIGENEERRASFIKRAVALRSTARDFIALFPIATDDPIGEIRSRLSEFEMLRASVERRTAEAQRFATSHGISETEAVVSSSDDSAELSKSISDADGEIIELERQKSIAESEYAFLARELEERPVLEERLRELKEKAALYEKNLGIIQKSKELLQKAKTNMTAKYLDGTRRAFEKYISLIENDNGEFSMDTSFTVMKREHGASRPEEAYSRGTKDIHALAVRLALTDALYENDVPPIILDDPFIAFDDNHTQKALGLLKKLSSDRQLIYFTCSKSRK